MGNYILSNNFKIAVNSDLPCMSVYPKIFLNDDWYKSFASLWVKYKILLEYSESEADGFLKIKADLLVHLSDIPHEIVHHDRQRIVDKQVFFGLTYGFSIPYQFVGRKRRHEELCAVKGQVEFLKKYSDMNNFVLDHLVFYIIYACFCDEQNLLSVVNYLPNQIKILFKENKEFNKYCQSQKNPQPDIDLGYLYFSFFLNKIISDHNLYNKYVATLEVLELTEYQMISDKQHLRSLLNNL